MRFFYAAAILKNNNKLSQIVAMSTNNKPLSQYDTVLIENGMEKIACNISSEEIEKNFDFIRCTMSDIHGIGRCRLIPAKFFSNLVNDGVQLFCGDIAFGPRSEYVAHEEILMYKHGNAVLRPCLDTLVPLKWAANGDFKICEILCESYWGPAFKKRVLEKLAKEKNSDNSAKSFLNGPGGILSILEAHPEDSALIPQAACPRYVVRRLLEKLELEFGFILFSSFEAEFICYKQGTLQPVFSGNDVTCSFITSEFESYLGQLYKGLQAAEVEVEALQTEFESGQFELAMKPALGIGSADKMFRIKHGVKEISRKNDMDATFMTQPDYDTVKMSGSGLHFNHSLLDKKTGANVMYDVSKEDKMSDIMRWWLAGIIKHSPAITALCCPTYNCYKRINKAPAPVKISWGHDDRSASYRIKASRGALPCCYLENRLPSGSANSYLVVAATLAAGMSGLRQRLELCPEGNEGAKNFPTSLEEALAALENDDVIVEALGEGFVRWFVKVKRDIEIEKLKTNRIELEREMYMKLL